MKTRLLTLLLLIGCLDIGVCSCSSDDNFVENAPLEDLTLDDYVGEKWNGEGIPSWLNERFIEFILDEDPHWAFSSYNAPRLYYVYRFAYQNNLMLAVSYWRYGDEINTGTLCYTDEGKKVDFNKVKNAFENTNELVWTNQWDKEQTPKLSDFGLEGAGVDWLQDVIDQACAKVQEPEQFLYQIGCSIDEESQCVIFAYEYTLNIPGNFPQGIYYLYSMDGEALSSQSYVIKFENDYANINPKLFSLCWLFNEPSALF